MQDYLMDYWYSLAAPAATPKDIQARLNCAARDVTASPPMRVVAFTTALRVT